MVELHDTIPQLASILTIGIASAFVGVVLWTIVWELVRKGHHA